MDGTIFKYEKFGERKSHLRRNRKFTQTHVKIGNNKKINFTFSFRYLKRFLILLSV